MKERKKWRTSHRHAQYNGKAALAVDNASTSRVSRSSLEPPITPIVPVSLPFFHGDRSFLLHA
jgi:hypothetical protein